MYKTVKILEETYEDAKELEKRLEKNREIAGLRKVTLSAAITYALTKTLEDLKSRKRFLSSAGGWADIDTEKLKREIYASRMLAKRAGVEF
ncbi:MAG: hypothetical protein HYW05_00585 [Candidatus Diapherotrites archaeon]|nr:hypothetical protein [Candidatus Diapherotrites archaeon]